MSAWIKMISDDEADETLANRRWILHEHPTELLIM